MLPLLLNAALAAPCAQYGPATSAVLPGKLDELSGLAASRRRKSRLYAHNDGDDARLFAIDTSANPDEEWELDLPGLTDWEDLALSACPDGDGDCLYVADIGADNRTDGEVRIYLVREPVDGRAPDLVEQRVARWPAGPRDAEALLVSPCDGRILVLTRADDGQAEVYEVPAGQTGLPLVQVATLTLSGPSVDDRRITAADWDADGTWLVVRTTRRAWAWATDPLDPDAHWSATPSPIDLPALPQAEALTLLPSGVLVTGGEGPASSLNRLVCEAPEPVEATCAPEAGCGCTTSPRPPWLALLLPLVLYIRTVSGSSGATAPSRKRTRTGTPYSTR